MKKYLVFLLSLTYLNHIIGHQLKALHLSVLLRHLADKHRHGAFVLRLEKIGNARKSDWLFLFQHYNGTRAVFEIMMKFVFIKVTEL